MLVRRIGGGLLCYVLVLGAIIFCALFAWTFEHQIVLLATRSKDVTRGAGYISCNDLNEQSIIVTFISNQKTESEENHKSNIYFSYVRTLLWQVLHDPHTRLRQKKDIPFVVMASPDVPLSQLSQFESEGARICLIEHIAAPTGLNSGQDRWWDQFSKLQMWNFTKVERILYIDADTLLLAETDQIWTKAAGAAASSFGSQFAALSDSMGWNHSLPPAQTDYFNAGFMMLKPVASMYEHIIHTMVNEMSAWQAEMQEQDLLNYVYRRSGPEPWISMDPKININHPTVKDVEWGIYSIHHQFHDLEGDEWSGDQGKYLSIMWYQKYGEMLGYWAAKASK